jgi:hypothetical protein
MISNVGRPPGPWFAGLILALFGSVSIVAQTRPAVSKASTVAALKTPDGQPDLQGTWTNGTATPFERPAALGAKAFFSEEEAAENARLAAERTGAPRPRRPGDVGNDNEAFVDTGYKPASTRQTSLIVDPPDGRIPILPAAEKQREFNVSSLDSYERLSPWDRCITRGPTALFPAAYNNGYQIVQTRDYVVIVSEMIHEARVVPLDGRPHVQASVKQWTGDSRGRWDGATLVVDTTNFHDRGWLATHAGAGRLRGVPQSDALHIVERFTRVDADTISYQMTVNDPNVYSTPWTFSLPLVRSDAYQIYEYACAEGNQAVALMLRGARTLERETIGSIDKP